MSTDRPTHTPDGLPIIYPLPPMPPRPADGAIAQCGACGLRIQQVMGYVCPNSNCPVFHKATCLGVQIGKAMP